MTAHVVQLSRSRGGVPKLAIDEAVVTANGLEGDKQRDRRFHGGPMRALCLYSDDLIEQLNAEGHPVARGTLGENMTIRGLDWSGLRPGTHLTIGEVEVEITSYAAPCKTIRGSFAGEEFKRIAQKLHRGWSRVYCRVLRPGTVRVNDPVSVVPASNHAEVQGAL
ncbi:MAG TPA: MOSC domain-containing protein [Gemmatimonadaceae bacterium]|jgi:MOSC domain-containing protein YiiM